MTGLTHEMLAEELNIAAEYAGCDVEFGSKPSERKGCCIVTWGTVGEPHENHDHQQEVHLRLAFGKSKSIPDHAKWDDFAECLAWASPERGEELFPGDSV